MVEADTLRYIFQALEQLSDIRLGRMVYHLTRKREKMEQNTSVQSEFTIGTTTYRVTSRFYEQGKEKEDFSTMRNHYWHIH